MLQLQQLSYIHPNKDLLFENLQLRVNAREKVALIGNNGTGKSTLLKIIAGELQPSSGQLKVEAVPYYVPQIFGQYNQLSLAQALRIDLKLNALKEILEGKVTEANLNLLGDDWTLEDRCREALEYWQLDLPDLSLPLESLSGGQKTKVFLAGISIHQPQFVLLDEPSNHLDLRGRELLYNFISNTRSSLLLVSHDRKLLNLLDSIQELSRNGIRAYGGNYDFYLEQKEIESNALSQDIQNREKALRKAREKERETLERQQKLDSRGKGKQEKAGVSRIMMNTLRNKAENSSSKLKSVHAEKISGITQDLQALRSGLPDSDKMKFGLDNSALHKGKILFSATGMNFSYDGRPLWKEDLDLQLLSGSRWAIRGNNGSGKTTLINLILGSLEPTSGKVYRAESRSLYIDQDYSLLVNRLSLYEQAQQFNASALQEHEIKIRLSRFLFSREDWDKPCGSLSGGERMRLLLCCLSIGSQAPDLIVLDEPTNNLDLQNLEILTAAINDYRGTLVVVSHDESFLQAIGVEEGIVLERGEFY